MRNRALGVRLVAVVLALQLAIPQALEARYNPRPGWNLFSHEDEVQLGKQAAADVEKKLPVLKESDPITRYV
ncbi:MAG: hypothetical protein ACRD2R_06955, partial [Terriglobales bacterium]